MLLRNSITTIALATALTTVFLAGVGARADDASKYPNWKGQWVGVGAAADAAWDPGKPAGAGQQAPLTPEYQAVYQKIMAAHASGVKDPTFTCIPPGMPRAMTVVFPMEIIIMPDTTYMIIEYDNQVRRIYTDGRAWPQDIEPAFAGYSIGQWTDADAHGRFNTLEVETRGFKGPRSFDASGIPLHEDNQTVVKERIYLDQANSDLLHDEVTTIDNALTHPWTVSSRPTGASPSRSGSTYNCSGRQSPRPHRQGELFRQRPGLSVAYARGPAGPGPEILNPP